MGQVGQVPTLVVGLAPPPMHRRALPMRRWATP